MLARPLRPNDTIGMIAPSQRATKLSYEFIIRAIRRRGFQVKTANNLFKSTHGYLATEKERADDFNEMILDDDVKMIFFSGGNGASEILPYINYDNIIKHPKLILSYSDGTSILDAIFFRTGLTVYYGQSPWIFPCMKEYDRHQFITHFLKGKVPMFQKQTRWITLRKGIASGTLIGGYLENMALLLNTEYFQPVEGTSYVLFLEDHKMFSDPSRVSALLTHMEQSSFIHQVSGLLFGCYTKGYHEDLLARLGRFGQKHQIPVVYSNDFGHGRNHGILPIGCLATLDANRQRLFFEYEA